MPEQSVTGLITFTPALSITKTASLLPSVTTFAVQEWHSIMIWDNPLRFDDRIDNGFEWGWNLTGTSSAGAGQYGEYFQRWRRNQSGKRKADRIICFQSLDGQRGLASLYDQQRHRSNSIARYTFNGKQEIINATVRYTTPLGWREISPRTTDSMITTTKMISSLLAKLCEPINVQALERSECDPATNTCVAIKSVDSTICI